MVDALRTAIPRISSAWRRTLILLCSHFIHPLSSDIYTRVVVLVQCLSLPQSHQLCRAAEEMKLTRKKTLFLGRAEFQVEQHRNHTRSCSLTTEGGPPAPMVLESKPVFGLSLRSIRAVLEKAQTLCPVTKGCLGEQLFLFSLDSAFLTDGAASAVPWA